MKFGILNCFIYIAETARTDPVANFVELGHVETCSESYSANGSWRLSLAKRDAMLVSSLLWLCAIF